MKHTHKRRLNHRTAMAAMVAVLAAVFLLSFTLGRYGVPLRALPGILCDGLVRFFTGGTMTVSGDWTGEMVTAVLHIRLPRILLACLVGGALAVAGAAYQGVFQNPMASPDVLGASSGAALGAALAILLGASASMVTLSAFVLGLLTVALAFLLSCRAPGAPVVNLILSGIMLSSLASAGTSYIKLVADPSSKLPEITYWLMGSLSGATMKNVGILLIPMVLGCVPLFLLRWRINLLTLGEEEARTLGVNTARLRLVVVLCATLVTAASIAAAGMIGWVGLVVPHMARKIIGGDYRRLLPGSLLCGALFLLVVDDLARSLLAVEIPIGILTALIGAPFFIYLLMRQEKTL